MDGLAGHYSASMGAHILNFLGGRGELTVRDTDLAAFLGFARPRKIRELIERLWSGDGDGDDRAVLPRSERPNCRPAMGRQPVGPKGGGERDYEVTEYWLTREQALIVAARSDTQRGLAVLEMIVRFFLAVLDSMRPMPAHRALAAPYPANQDPWIDSVIAWLAKQPDGVMLAGVRPDEVHYFVFGCDPNDRDGSSLARIAKILRYVGLSRDRFRIENESRFRMMMQRARVA